MRQLKISVLAIAGCSVSGNREVTSHAEIQRLARMRIPLAATNLRCATESDMDQLAYGRFEIPANDLNLVLAQIPADTTVKPFDGYSNVTSHRMQESWWQPELLKDPRIADWSEPGFSWNLMIGESADPKTVTVYFFNFTL